MKAGRPESLGREFNLLWSAQTISLVGDRITIFVVPTVMIFVLDASALEVGVVAMAQYLGIPLLGPVAGVLVDRWDKRLTQGSEGSHKAQISQASRREAEDDLNFRPSFGGARRAT